MTSTPRPDYGEALTNAARRIMEAKREIAAHAGKEGHETSVEAAGRIRGLDFAGHILKDEYERARGQAAEGG